MKNFNLYLALCILLGGCGVFGPVNQIKMQQYLIVSNKPLHTCNNISSNSIHIKTTTSISPYNTNSMLYSQTPYTINQYAYSVWATLPEDTINQSIVQSITGSCIFSEVYSNNILIPANYELTSQILTLKQDITNNKGTAILKIKIQLINNANHTVKSKTFTETDPIIPSPENMAIGTSRNLQEFLNMLNNWIRAQIND